MIFKTHNSQMKEVSAKVNDQWFSEEVNGSETFEKIVSLVKLSSKEVNVSLSTSQYWSQIKIIIHVRKNFDTLINSICDVTLENEHS